MIVSFAGLQMDEASSLGAQTERRGGAGLAESLLGGKFPRAASVIRLQSSFRIVPMPRFLKKTACELSPYKSRKNVSAYSYLPSPLTSMEMVLDVWPGAK